MNNPSKSEQARRLKADNPKLSEGEIAKRLGVTPGTVHQALKAKCVSRGTDKEPLTVWDEEGDKALATVVIPGLKTLEDLLNYMEVDRSIWEVDHHLINKWEVGTKHPQTGQVTVTPLFQIKAWLKRKTPQIQGMEEILKRMRENAPIIPMIKRRLKVSEKVTRTLEMDIVDPHLGLLCYYPEADADQTLESAGNLLLEAVDVLLARAKPFGPFKEIVIPFGNDYVHVDGPGHTTTAGTPQPEAISWKHVFAYAKGLAIEWVNRLRQVAPVKVYLVPGNHSEQTDFSLAHVLDAYFHNCKDVEVDCSPSPYKIHRAGCNLIGWEHGHHVRPIRLAALMANERPKDWAETEFREWHLADQHRVGSPNMSMEEQGVSPEYVPGMTVPNAWHRQKSFSHQKRASVAYVWDWKAGQIARLKFNISQYSHQPLQ